MGATRFTSETIQDAPLVRTDEPVRTAVGKVRESGLPALPVVDRDRRLRGTFGEREFIEAVFPGYVAQLRSAAFVPRALDELIDRRLECAAEPVAAYTVSETVAVRTDHSDVQLAEIFLHHRVLIVPVLDGDGRVEGVVTRRAFFEALVRHFLDRSS